MHGNEVSTDGARTYENPTIADHGALVDLTAGGSQSGNLDGTYAVGTSSNFNGGLFSWLGPRLTPLAPSRVGGQRASGRTGGDDCMALRLREQDLDWRDVDDELGVLDAQGGAYLAVQGSGAVLWRLFANSTIRESPVEALIKTYDVDSSRAGDDLGWFLATLRERGLLAGS